MLAPLAQLWILIAFAIAGVLVGVAQMYAERSCPCCGLQYGAPDKPESSSGDG